MRQLIQALSIVGLLVVTQVAWSGPVEDAQKKYENREDLDGVNEAIVSLEEYIQSAQDKELREALRLLSRMYYYVGSVTEDKGEMKALHEKGFKFADQAIEKFFKITPIPKNRKDKSGFPWNGNNAAYMAKAKEYAVQLKGSDVVVINDLLYLRSINMAAYGQNESALKKLRLLRFSRGMFYLMDLLDEESNNYGASRVLGWIEYNAGNATEGLARLQSAFENTLVTKLPGKRLSKSAGTSFYYASALLDTLKKNLNFPGQKELGRKILTDLATLTDEEVEKLDPRSVPETKQRREEANELLGSL